MFKFALPLAVLLTSLSSAAYAQHGGTQQEQAACARDVARHCRAVMDQGDFTVLACLKEHRAKLTRACNQVLISHGQ